MSNNKGRNSKQRQALRARLMCRKPTAPCCFCARHMTLAEATLEHVIPLSKGGSWNIKNLRLSCHDCNQIRGNMDFHQYKKRFRRRSP